MEWDTWRHRYETTIGQMEMNDAGNLGYDRLRHHFSINPFSLLDFAIVV